MIDWHGYVLPTHRGRVQRVGQDFTATLRTVTRFLGAIRYGARVAWPLGNALAGRIAARRTLPGYRERRPPASSAPSPFTDEKARTWGDRAGGTSSPTEPDPTKRQRGVIADASGLVTDSREEGSHSPPRGVALHFGDSSSGSIVPPTGAPTRLRQALQPAQPSSRTFRVMAEQSSTVSGGHARFHLGWILSIALCSAIGLGTLAVADEASRRGHAHAATSVLFWLGLLLIFVPIALRALARDVDRQERLTLVIMLGVALYLTKVLASPHAFTFSDEYTHLRNTQDILRTRHLFAYNPLLPTAAYYPGLAALTAGLVDLTGLSAFTVGLMIMGMARVLFCACFYLVAERVTGSSRAAAAASLVYAANPMFLFWGAAFSYENLALPFAAFVVWWIGWTRGRGATASVTVAIVGVVAVTITHHVVGFALSALLAGWWLAERVGSHSAKSAQRQLGLLALLAGSATLTWFFVVADPASSYLLSNNLVPALRDTGSLVLGHTPPRKLYTSGGTSSHVWEFVAGFTAIAVLLLVLPLALRRAWRSHHRASVVVAMIVAIAFPLSLVPRLAPVGVAISGRSSEYVYAALGCVIGLLLAEAASSRGARPHPIPVASRRSPWAVIARHRTIIAAVFVTVVFIGNVTIGTASYQRLPEATHPRGYPSSVQPDVIAASKWARAHLGVNQPFAASAIDSYALATYGGQETLDQNRIWPVFFAESMDSWAVETIKAAGVRYVLVDWRMTRGVPPTPGYYVSPFEPDAGQYTRAFPTPGLEKFSSTPCARLIYGSGAVQIFDLSQIQSGVCRSLSEPADPTGRVP